MESNANMISAYSAAALRVAALQALDGDEVNPLCRTQWLTHGRRTKRVVVFIHGFTNCPQQFSHLAQLVFARGCNVLNARMPRHGMRDRLSRAMDGLTAMELKEWTNHLLDSAQGLGERVTLVGMSLGGTLALWAAQTRADLDRAIAIAPLIAPPRVPRPVVTALMPIAQRLPNIYVWWDSKQKADLPGPQHAYPGFPTRALAAAFRIAREVERAAAVPGALPQAGAVLLVVNAVDPAVDSRAAKAVIEQWRSHGAAHADIYEFDAALNLIHDIVDELQENEQTPLVYPVLLELICPAAS